MRAVIFDFDGVLAHSEPVHEAAIRDAVRAIGLEPTWSDWSRFVGRGDRDVFATILADAGRATDERALAALRDAKSRSIAARLARGDAAPIPGALDLFRAAANALPIAVCSGSRALEVLPVLRAFGVESLPTAVVTADDVARTKPDPEPYTLAAHRLGVSPSACAVIEDTTVGVSAAVAAGCACVAVGTTSPAEALLAAGARRVFDAIRDVTLESLEELWRR